MIFKHIIIVFHLLLCLSSWSQDGRIPLDGPCSDAYVIKAKGKWIKQEDLVTVVTKTQQEEINKRLGLIHEACLKLYSQPIGVDIRWKRLMGISYFGTRRNYRYNRDSVLTFDYSNLPHFLDFSYWMTCPRYYCLFDGSKDRNFMMPGVKNEGGEGLFITINNLGSAVGGPPTDDSWTINGFPVRMRGVVLNEKWKGYDVFNAEPGSNSRTIIFHRSGVSPYKPVTKKQYLDYCLIYVARLHDKIIEGLKKMAVRSIEEQEKEKKAKLAKFEKDFGSDPKRLKSAVDYYLSGYQTDQQRRDEQVEKMKKNKDQELKPFRDELEKATNEGTLDSPAIVRLQYYPYPVFETDPEKGHMLVIENPDYIRKDLPAYVPQIIVLTSRWSDYPPHKAMEKRMLEDFPAEKLQAMIDK